MIKKLLWIPFIVFAYITFKVVRLSHNPEDRLLTLTSLAMKNSHSNHDYSELDLYILKKLRPKATVSDAFEVTAFEYAIRSKNLTLVKEVSTLLERNEGIKILEKINKKYKHYLDEKYLHKVEEIVKNEWR